MATSQNTTNGQSNQEQLTLLLGEPPAKLGPSPEKGWASTILAAASPSHMLALLKNCDPSGSFGKMSQASIQQESPEAPISPPLSGRWLNSGIISPTERLTLNTSESRSAAVDAYLSDILEIGDLPRRYFLSQKACAGILRRAERRGKELPPALKAALVQASNTSISKLSENTETTDRPRP
jgi:hypothetical protein